MGNSNCCFRQTLQQKQIKKTIKQKVIYEECSLENIDSSDKEIDSLEKAKQKLIYELQEKQLRNQQTEQRNQEITAQDRLLIAVAYLIQGTCQGLKNTIPIIHQLQGILDNKREYCFFDPNKLSQMFNLVEMQGPSPFQESDSEGSDLENEDEEGENQIIPVQKSLACQFWQQIQYFIDDEIINVEDEEFQVVVILHLQNQLKYPFAIQKKIHFQTGNPVFYVHDVEKVNSGNHTNNNKNSNNNKCLNEEGGEQSQQQKQQQQNQSKNYNCKEIVFQNQEKFNSYLNLLENYFAVANINDYKFKLQIVNFQYISDKSSSNYSDDNSISCELENSFDVRESIENHNNINNDDNQNDNKCISEQDNSTINTTNTNRLTQSTNCYQ